MDGLEQYTLWREHLQGSQAQELQALNHDERVQRFSKTLRFGTAGIRAKMELGPGGLNDYTVAKTAYGVAAYLLASTLPKRCAIGYDSRHNSKEFSQLCARILAEQGIEVFLYDRVAPTPMVSFAVRYLECGVGLVVSASHNTKEYNGLKCYGPDGCQMTQAHADLVLKEIENTPWFQMPQKSFQALEEQKRIQFISQAVWQAYYEAVLGQMMRPEACKALRVVYSPLCGAGAEPVVQILRQLGVEAFLPESQSRPSGDFATCPVPNPEEEQAFAESYRLAETVKPDLVLATDPDSDRIAAAIAVEGGFKKFTGNELGCLLLDYLLSTGQELGKLSKQPVAVTSVVSTPLAEKLCRHYGCKLEQVLTGFKYIGEAILQLERDGREEDFVFGFEESCGFLKGSYVRDKDAVVAAALLCEMTAHLKAGHRTLLDQLERIYAQFGYYETRLQSIVYASQEQQTRCETLIAGLQTQRPKKLGALTLTAVADYSRGVISYADGHEEPTNLPQESMIGLWTQDGGRIMIRPSGTEPKLKIYYTALASSRQAAEQAAALLQAEIAKRL